MLLAPLITFPLLLSLTSINYLQMVASFLDTSYVKQLWIVNYECNAPLKSRHF
jgi:hypothetical protein